MINLNTISKINRHPVYHDISLTQILFNPKPQEEVKKQSESVKTDLPDVVGDMEGREERVRLDTTESQKMRRSIKIPIPTSSKSC